MTEQHTTRAMRRIVDQLGFQGTRLPGAGLTLYLQRPPLYPRMAVRNVGSGRYEIDYDPGDPEIDEGAPDYETIEEA